METFSSLEHSLKYRSYIKIYEFKIPKTHTQHSLNTPELTPQWGTTYIIHSFRLRMEK